jgi:hypothetical protein
MADAVTSQTLIDGERNLVMKFTNISDGTGEAAVLKVDVSTMLGAPTTVRITRIHYATFGMAARLLWDATTDVVAWTIAADQEGCHDFSAFGGISNNAGSGITGDIMLTTIGHSAGDSYSIIVEMQKQ